RLRRALGVAPALRVLGDLSACLVALTAAAGTGVLRCERSGRVRRPRSLCAARREGPLSGGAGRYPGTRQYLRRVGKGSAGRPLADRGVARRLIREGVE